jgi:hypothetical protein
LKGLKSGVQQHLGFFLDDDVCPELECNCRLAPEIEDKAILDGRGPEDSKAAHPALLVHGNKDVVVSPVGHLTQDVLQATAKKYLAQPYKTLTVLQ